jgi:predicted Zn-dependent peptidase
MSELARRVAPAATRMVIAVVVLVAVFASCGKDVEEAEKFPSRETAKRMEPGKLTHFRLANGITVYMQEEHSQPEIAVEVLYGAGVIHEGEGKTHVSRLLPHMLLFAPTASFGPDEAVEAVQESGRINAEVVGKVTHFDYVVPSDQLDLAFQIEAERLTSVEFNEDQIEKYASKCADDIDSILEEPQLALTKYGLMAFNQAFNYGKTSIPIYDVAHERTPDDLHQFHKSQYRLEDMTIVIIGDFDATEAAALAKKRFEHLESPAAPPTRTTNPIDRDSNASWDIPASVVILAFPGPYKNDEERLVLTMFGTFLNRELMIHEDLNKQVESTYCSNQIYSVDGIPFFVFLEARTGRNLQDVRSTALLAMDQAVGRVNEKLFAAMQHNITDFVKSSVLHSQFNVRNLPHHQIIGQEALNTGIKHYLKEGRTVAEFEEFVNSITYEEGMEYLTSKLNLDNIVTVTLTPSGQAREPRPKGHRH